MVRMGIGNIKRGNNQKMNSQQNTAIKEDSDRMSLMHTLHAVSHLSRDEFELLKKLRCRDGIKEPLNDGEADMLPKVRRILDNFNAQSIQEVIEIV